MTATDPEIADLAEYIAAEYCPTGAVEPRLILKSKGITHCFGHYGDTFDGMLECKDRRFHVYCNLDRVEHPESTRARFTLAHELGHYFIDDHRNALLSGRVPSHPSRTNFESGNPVERAADHFASHLLLPSDRFLCAVGKVDKLGLAAVLAVAKEFRTSVTSTALKYIRADLVPCTLIKWLPNAFAWKWFSPTTYQRGYRKTIEDLSHVPPDSATALATAGLEPPASGYFECGSTAATWYPFVRAGSHQDAVLMEQAIPLGRFGTLTLLYPIDEEGRGKLR